MYLLTVWVPETVLGIGYILRSIQLDKGAHANTDTAKVVFNAILGDVCYEGGIVLR